MCLVHSANHLQSVALCFCVSSRNCAVTRYLTCLLGKCFKWRSQIVWLTFVCWFLTELLQKTQDYGAHFRRFLMVTIEHVLLPMLTFLKRGVDGVECSVDGLYA